MDIKIPPLFKKTNPLWTKKILKRRSFEQLSETCIIDNMHLDINKFNCCIVGETLNLFDKPIFKRYTVSTATKFHNGCTICLEFSRKFHVLITCSKNSKISRQRLEIELKYFTEHIKTSHPKIIEQITMNKNKPVKKN